MSPTYDVLVIALGGMGSTAAHPLPARGALDMVTVHPRLAGPRVEEPTRRREPYRHGVRVPILAGLAPTAATAHPIGLFDPRRLAAAPA